MGNDSEYVFGVQPGERLIFTVVGSKSSEDEDVVAERFNDLVAPERENDMTLDQYIQGTLTFDEDPPPKKYGRMRVEQRRLEAQLKQAQHDRDKFQESFADLERILDAERDHMSHVLHDNAALRETIRKLEQDLDHTKYRLHETEAELRRVEQGFLGRRQCKSTKP